MTRLAPLAVRLALISVLTAASALGTLRQDGEWRHAGVGGGGFMTDVLFDPRPNHPNTMYVGSDATGLFKSADCGVTWASSLRGLSDDYVHSVAIRPDDGTLFVATLAGISRMTDNDGPWEDGLPVWENVHAIQPNQQNPDNLLNWSTVEVDPIDPEVVWAGIGTFRLTKGEPGKDGAWVYAHVWRSEDGGDSWTALPKICPPGETCDAGGLNRVKPLFYSIGPSDQYGVLPDDLEIEIVETGLAVFELGPLAAASLDGAGSGALELGLKLAAEDSSTSGHAVEIASEPGFHQLWVEYQGEFGPEVEIVHGTTLQGIEHLRYDDGVVVAENFTTTTDPVTVGHEEVGDLRTTERAFLGFDLSTTVFENVEHVWLALEVEGFSQSTELHAKVMTKPIDGFGTVPAVHSIVLEGYDHDTGHPGAEVAYVSTTAGVYRLRWSGSSWEWDDLNAGLPHNDCRELAATYLPDDTIEKLYLALHSVWKEGDPYTVEDHEDGFGGGVWVSPAPTFGINWQCLNDAELNLPDGQGDPPIRPKTIRRIAIDHDEGTIYAALTGEFANGQTSKRNEGIWRLNPLQADPQWLRYTAETRCKPGFVPTVDFDWYPQFGPIDGLGVDPSSGDVFFTTASQFFRSSSMTCGPGLGDRDWQPIHTELTLIADDQCPPDLYSTTGMDVTSCTYLTVDPQQPTTWLVSYHDVGLARSDDSGATWDVVKLSDGLDFRAHPQEELSPEDLDLLKANAESMHRNPSTDEWLGVYRLRERFVSVDFKLFMTSGTPSSTSEWFQQDLDIQNVKMINDLLYVDASTVLVATDNGLYCGVREDDPVDENHRWTFEPDDRVLPIDFSRYATAIVAEEGADPSRKVWVAFRKEVGPGGYGGVVHGPAVGTTWTIGTVPGQGTFTNVLSLARSTTHANRLYAGNGSTRVGPSGVGAVWKTTDGGDTWSLACETFSPTGDPGDAYAPNDFDVVGLAVLNIPSGTPPPHGPTSIDRVFAAITPRGEYAPGPSYEGDVWGGVFASDDAAASFQSRFVGLNAGDSLFLRVEPYLPHTLFYGTRGNGGYVMEEWIPPGGGGGPGIGN